MRMPPIERAVVDWNGPITGRHPKASKPACGASRAIQTTNGEVGYILLCSEDTYERLVTGGCECWCYLRLYLATIPKNKLP